MTFRECLRECAANRDLLREFDRLKGTNLCEVGRRSPMAAMIDEATGRDRDSCNKFIEFVYECVWLRAPRRWKQERADG